MKGSDQAQWNTLAAIVGAIVAYARKGFKISSVELRVVDPRTEAELVKLRGELMAAREQALQARLEAADVRTELATLQTVRGEWQTERTTLLERIAALEKQH